MFCRNKRKSPWLKLWTWLTWLIALCEIVKIWQETMAEIEQEKESDLDDLEESSASPWKSQPESERKKKESLSAMRKEFQSWKGQHTKGENITLSFLFPDTILACAFMDQLATEGISSLLDEKTHVVDVFILGSYNQKEVEEMLDLLETFCQKKFGRYEGFAYN